MEKIKDIVYQISDILFGLIVLLAVILIFTFQLYGWFNIEMPQSIARFVPNSASIDTYANENITAPDTTDSSDKKDTVSDQADSTDIASSAADIPKSSENETSGLEQSKSPAEATLRNIVIAPGSTSSSIGNALYENNIIKSVDDFKNRLTELKLETKIKAGTFSIPQNAPLDDVIRIITS